MTILKISAVGRLTLGLGEFFAFVVVGVVGVGGLAADLLVVVVVDQALVVHFHHFVVRQPPCSPLLNYLVH
jgi:hypothetical protein